MSRRSRVYHRISGNTVPGKPSSDNTTSGYVTEDYAITVKQWHTSEYERAKERGLVHRAVANHANSIFMVDVVFMPFMLLDRLFTVLISCVFSFHAFPFPSMFSISPLACYRIARLTIAYFCGPKLYFTVITTKRLWYVYFASSSDNP